MKFGYFTGAQAERYAFIHIPKLLVKDGRFKGMSIHSKVLYGLYLDRMRFAAKNRWFDDGDRVYVIYPVKEIAKDMLITENKASALVKELEENGLVEKSERGKGMSAVIYIKDITKEVA